MKIEDDKVQFSSGRSVYANCGIIGLSPELEVSEGCDGSFALDLSDEERRELSGYMIAQWRMFGGAVHDSDCAVHNAPALPRGECDCGADAESNIDKLRTALTKLSNEVLGSLPLMEPLARREFGNTNYALLIQRAEEARALLTHTGA